MERFAKIANDFQPLTFFAKRFILDIWQGSEYVSPKLRKMMIKASIANISAKYFVSRCIGYHCFRSKELGLRLDSFSNSTRDVDIDLTCMHWSVIIENIIMIIFVMTRIITIIKKKHRFKLVKCCPRIHNYFLS